MKNSSSQEVVKLQKNINLKSLCQGTFYKFSRLKNLEIFLATGRKLLPELVFKNTMNISLRKTKNTDTHTHTHTPHAHQLPNSFSPEKHLSKSRISFINRFGKVKIRLLISLNL